MMATNESGQPRVRPVSPVRTDGFTVYIASMRSSGKTAELEANDRLRHKLECIRLAAGPLMNLGDVTRKTVPKMCLIAPPQQGGLVSTRTFIPHTVHEAIGVLGAVSTATACLLPGSVAEGIAVLPNSPELGYSVEHPTGEFTVRLELSMQNGVVQEGKSGVIRTARLLSRGEVMVPSLD